jgi:hypothetical protein
MEEHKEKASNFIENLDYNCITYTSRKDWSQLLRHCSWDCVVISRSVIKILKSLNLISNCHKIHHTQEFCHQICHALQDWHLKPPKVIKPHKTKHIHKSFVGLFIEFCAWRPPLAMSSILGQQMRLFKATL